MKLTIENVSHQFGDVKALTNIQCELTEGIYGLLGTNGAGKSTLIRAMVDLIKPTSGHIALDGRAIHQLGNQYRECLGYLPQNFQGYPQFTAEKFLNYIANLKGMSPTSAHTEVEQLLCLVDLIDVKHKKIKTFSGGMLRRLGIAQALLNNPTILILDEPTAGLDPIERTKLRQILMELSQHKLILLSTHIVSDIETIADEVLLMNEGELLVKAIPEELTAQVNSYTWEVEYEKFEATNDSLIISQIKNEEGCKKVRIISEYKPYEEAVNVAATLEDAYVYYMNRENKQG